MTSAEIQLVMHPPEPNFAHIVAMSDTVGLFEHANGLEPAREHGYCVDDVARGLVVLLRQPTPDESLAGLADLYLRFVIESQSADGAIANRRSTDGSWTTPARVGDWWGRAIWGLGAAARAMADPRLQAVALAAAETSMRLRASWSRSMTFAALGAAEILTVNPEHDPSLRLLADAAEVIGHAQTGVWIWPEARLTYGNASVAEALIVAGHFGGDRRALSDGLRMLEWLLTLETVAGHLSVTPVGGAGPGFRRPAFDQQPIEVAAMADACARAAEVTGDAGWLEGVGLAVGWMLGGNDTGIPMYDPESGGGYDGLTSRGRNGNCGAESTLAALSVLQHAHARTLAVSTP